MSAMPYPVMNSTPFRPPPGLELLPPPPGLELPCHGVGAKLEADGTHSSCSSPRREISYASTADTDSAEPRRLTSSASNDTTETDTSETFEYCLGELVDGPAYVTGLSACGDYVPGRLLRRAVSQDEVPPPPPPPPVALELERHLDRPARPVVALLRNPGSVGHACGLCQPCEFFHRGRCTAGVDCKYCHLCGPEEAKARRKAKKAMMKGTWTSCNGSSRSAGGR
jgi:hypothetical protein